MILEKKKEIRQEIKQVLQSYKNNFYKDSIIITEKIISCPEYKKADTILTYMALPDEVDININKLAHNSLEYKSKKIFIPKVRKETTTIDFFMYTPLSKIKSGAYNIPEPEKEEEMFNVKTPLEYGKILILIPGRSFTLQGKRLGRGKGFYDRFLQDIKNNFPKENITMAGVCFKPQLKKDLPINNFDITMDYIFTTE